MSKMDYKSMLQTTLGELVSKEKKSIISGPFGSNVGKRFFKEEGIPLIRGNNLTKGEKKFKDNGFVFLTREKADELNCYAIKNDLIFTAVGTIGQVGIIDEKLKFDEYVISNKQLRVRFDISKITPLFAYYWFSSYWIQKLILQRNVGSTVPLINLSVLKGLPITLPKSINTQNNIVDVLENIYLKIELNNKINQELESMAKTLYDYWFVQFDFPCLPEDYRLSGQVNPNPNPSNELVSKIKSVCTYTQTGGLPIPDGKKWFVYVVLCQDGTFYKGITNDLYRRYYEHKTGQGAEWTKVHIPKKIIHYEEFETQQQAAKREKELKTGFGRTWLKREYDKFLKYGATSKDGLPAHQTRLMMAGKMVFNVELKREIPVGWESGTFETISTIIGGSTPSKAVNENFTIEKNMSWITPKDLSNNKGKKYITRGEWDVTELGIKSASLKIMPANTILLSSRAPIGYLAISREEVTTNQGFKSFVPKSHYSSEFIYYCVKNQIPKIEANSSGSTFKEVSGSTLKILSISIPPKNVLTQYDKNVKSIFRKQDILELENQKLSELRDWLLPMLMNGQVSVGEAEEKAVGATKNNLARKT